MVDLLKDWNPNKYLVDVENEPKDFIDGQIIEEDSKEDDEYVMYKSIKHSWANNTISTINKVINGDFNFTNKEIIYTAITIIMITIVYFILYATHNLLKPKFQQPQDINIRILSD